VISFRSHSSCVKTTWGHKANKTGKRDTVDNFSSNRKSLYYSFWCHASSPAIARCICQHFCHASIQLADVTRITSRDADVATSEADGLKKSLDIWSTCYLCDFPWRWLYFKKRSTATSAFSSTRASIKRALNFPWEWHQANSQQFLWNAGPKHMIRFWNPRSKGVPPGLLLVVVRRYEKSWNLNMHLISWMLSVVEFLNTCYKYFFRLEFSE